VRAPKGTARPAGHAQLGGATTGGGLVLFAVLAEVSGDVVRGHRGSGGEVRKSRTSCLYQDFRRTCNTSIKPRRRAPDGETWRWSLPTPRCAGKEAHEPI